MSDEKPIPIRERLLRAIPETYEEALEQARLRHDHIPAGWRRNYDPLPDPAPERRLVVVSGAELLLQYILKYRDEVSDLHTQWTAAMKGKGSAERRANLQAKGKWIIFGTWPAIEQSCPEVESALEGFADAKTLITFQQKCSPARFLDTDGKPKDLAKLLGLMTPYIEELEIQIRRVRARERIAPLGSDNLPGEPKSRQMRKKTGRRQQRNPTTKQINAIMVVNECDGNFAEAARQLGVNPKTAKQHYEAGMTNAGSLARKLGKPKTHTIESKSRGQLPIAGKDNGPGHIGPNPKSRPIRDQR